jgi:flagellum-specific peptidoglycan hydrolase FlgJ
MNDHQLEFLDKAAAEAERAHHPFPKMAAAEAALESTFGVSEIARDANNLFGMKQHRHPIYGTMTLPTREHSANGWEVIDAYWVKYPDWSSCFADRLSTLGRLSPVYIHYRRALDATNPVTYATEVSKTWSTDPDRGKKVISIYNDYLAAKGEHA